MAMRTENQEPDSYLCERTQWCQGPRLRLLNWLLCPHLSRNYVPHGEKTQFFFSPLPRTPDFHYTVDRTESPLHYTPAGTRRGFWDRHWALVLVLDT